MSLSTAEIYPALRGVLDAAERTYTLSRTERGWVLLARDPGTTRGWSVPLAPHGAGTEAPSRVARAVGVRVLHEHGVDVEGWLPEPAGRSGAPADLVALTTTAATAVRSGLRRQGPRGH